MILQKVRPGEPIYADQYNRMVDAVNTLLTMTTDAPLEMDRIAGNMRLRLNAPEPVKIVELTEDLPVDTYDAACKRVEFADTGSQEFTTDTGYITEAKYGNLANGVNNGVWLDDEWVPATTSSGKLVPLVDPGPHLAKVTTLITARSGTTIGTGVALVYEVNTATGVVSTSGHSVTVKNTEATSIAVASRIGFPGQLPVGETGDAFRLRREDARATEVWIQ